jgi:hypothetical protein
LVLQYVTPARSTVWQFGGGVQRDINHSTGIRIDVRANASPADAALVLTNTSLVSSGTPAGFVEQDPTSSNLRIVFSNTPSVRPSLSGTQQAGLKTFEVTGTRWQINVSAGWFWSF